MVTDGKRFNIEKKPDEDVPAYKLQQVKDIMDLAKKHKVIGLVRITGIPGSQLQQMRKNLDAGVIMKVVRNNLLYLGLKEVLGDLKALDDFLGTVQGQTALIATEMNPFRLYRQLEATKTKAPARGGEAAPEDVFVEEGETEFKAGPIVGDLQKVGIPAGIVSGKVIIKNTKVVVKEGDVITAPLATMLTRLNIFPLTVGLDLRAALEEGTLYRKDVLSVDEDEIRGQLQMGAASAFNLAMFVAYPSAATTKALIAKAYNQALSLAIEAMVFNKDSVGPMMAKAAAQAQALRLLTEGGELPTVTKDTPKDEPDKESPKEEKSKEEREGEAAAGLGSLFGE